MPADTINPLEHEEWDAFVLDHPRFSFFHSSAWAQTLTESYGYQPVYFLLREQGDIEAALPVMGIHSRLTGKRGISLPFTDTCPGLYQEQEQLDELLEHAMDYGRRNRWRYLELRDCGLRTPAQASASYVEHILSLTPSEETLLPRLRSSVRRALRKAEREGVQVAIEHSMDAVRRFYALNCRTRKEHGLPPQPFYFFQNLHRFVLSRGHGMIVAASHGETTIAASVFLHMGTRAMYKYGASDNRYDSLRGNNAVMWRAIRWYAAHGYESLSLGKTRPENAGLLQFKRGWGGQETRIDYFRYDFSSQAFTKNRDFVAGRHNQLFRRLPIPVARVIGSMLYKHVA